jgi:endophilin-A
LYDYEPRSESELGLKKGDVITVTFMGNDGWWRGKFQEKSGYFPKTYVMLEEAKKGKRKFCEISNS